MVGAGQAMRQWKAKWCSTRPQTGGAHHSENGPSKLSDFGTPVVEGQAGAWARRMRAGESEAPRSTLHSDYSSFR